MPYTSSIDNINSVQYNLNRPVPKKYIDHPTYTEYVYETTASTGKKVGVGIASGFFPGVGQCINGQWGKGIGMFAGNIIIKVLSKILPKPIGLIAALALNVWTIIDAVKHAKSETVQIVPKDNTDTQNLDYAA